MSFFGLIFREGGNALCAPKILTVIAGAGFWSTRHKNRAPIANAAEEKNAFKHDPIASTFAVQLEAPPRRENQKCVAGSKIIEACNIQRGNCGAWYPSGSEQHSLGRHDYSSRMTKALTPLKRFVERAKHNRHSKG